MSNNPRLLLLRPERAVQIQQMTTYGRGEEKKIKPKVKERLPGILAITKVVNLFNSLPLSRISKKQRRGVY